MHKLCKIQCYKLKIFERFVCTVFTFELTASKGQIDRQTDGGRGVTHNAASKGTAA